MSKRTYKGLQDSIEWLYRTAVPYATIFAQL